MSTDPYESLQAAGQDAAGRVSGPAIALMVVGIINVLMALYAIVNGAVTMVMGDQLIQNNPGFQELQQQPDAPQLDIEQMNQFMAIGGAVYVGVGILGLICAALVIYGGVQMKKLKSHGLAMTAAIVAMIPVLSCCCPAGLPVGIWALAVLMKPEIKAAFS